MRPARGFTLVELVVFIVVAALLGLGFFSVFGSMVSEDSPQAGETTKATQLAQERMELILAQKHAVGFTAFADPCGWLACTLPDTRYTVAATIINAWAVDNDIARYRVITVTVTDTVQSRTAATLSTLVANY